MGVCISLQEKTEFLGESSLLEMELRNEFGLGDP
jgi:hypothetical protein